jgi:hypothetical protein
MPDAYTYTGSGQGCGWVHQLRGVHGDDHAPIWKVSHMRIHHMPLHVHASLSGMRIHTCTVFHLVPHTCLPRRISRGYPPRVAHVCSWCLCSHSPS